MKLRHAAALALVGFYLMIPPEGQNQAPLQQWKAVRSFDTAQACEDASSKARMVFGQLIKEFKTTPGARPEDFNAQCVSTDDPRLKAK